MFAKLKITDHLSKTIFREEVMLGLALISVVLLFVEIIASIQPEQSVVIQYIDLSIASIFFLEFVFGYAQAKNKIYFLKTHWWHLIAAIPITSYTTQALRSLQILRVMPLIEILRFARLIVRLRMIIQASQKYTKHAIFIYLITALVSVIFLGALSFNYFEADTNSNVHTFWDSFYWALITTATVGYGDIYPTTFGGRLTAIFLIFSGISTVGTFVTVLENIILKNEG